jgi:hypothetical protein
MTERMIMKTTSLKITNAALTQRDPEASEYRRSCLLLVLNQRTPFRRWPRRLASRWNDQAHSLAETEPGNNEEKRESERPPASLRKFTRARRCHKSMPQLGTQIQLPAT